MAASTYATEFSESVSELEDVVSAALAETVDDQGTKFILSNCDYTPLFAVYII